MRYIILEDERLAVDRLKRLIAEVRPEYSCVVSLDSVESAVISLTALKADLIFMDIQLADGLSFDILDQIKIDTPIIFTTAYDQYALQAFSVNSIDYLLKPIDQEELAKAISKFEQYRTTPQKTSVAESMQQLVKYLNPNGKERFVIKIGDRLKTVNSADVQMIYSQDKGTYLFTADHKRFLVDYTLDGVFELLSPSDFYRISRKFIVNIHHITDIISYTNSRLEIGIKGFNGEPVIVAREKVQDFKSWLDR